MNSGNVTLRKSIVFRDDGEFKKGDTVWMIALQVRYGTHYCKYVKDAVFISKSKKDARMALEKIYDMMDRDGIRISQDNPNKVEIIDLYLDFE